MKKWVNEKEKICNGKPEISKNYGDKPYMDKVAFFFSPFCAFLDCWIQRYDTNNSNSGVINTFMGNFCLFYHILCWISYSLLSGTLVLSRKCSGFEEIFSQNN